MRNVRKPILLHKDNENGHFEFKTQVLGQFLLIGRHFLCTSAVVLNFMHKRGGFTKSLKTIAPVVENKPSQNRQKKH